MQGTRGVPLASRGISLSLRDLESGVSGEMVLYHCECRKRYFMCEKLTQR
jgi:hypothetical protein